MEQLLENKLSPEHKTSFDYLAERVESEILPHMAMHTVYFPDHGIGHSRRIIENLDRILSSSKVENISGLDSYALLTSAYLHDIGMLISKKDDKQLTDDQIRDLHHELSYDFVRSEYGKIGIKSKNVANLVADVCKSHRRRVVIEDALEDDYPLAGDTVHPRFVSSVFRLADALDTDSRRAPEIASDYVMSLPPEHRMHWQACQLISGFEFRDNHVFLRAEIEKEDDIRLVRWKIAESYDELWRIKDILAANHLPLVNVVCDVKNTDTGKTQKLDGKTIFREFSRREIEARLVIRAIKESLS